MKFNALLELCISKVILIILIILFNVIERIVRSCFPEEYVLNVGFLSVEKTFSQYTAYGVTIISIPAPVHDRTLNIGKQLSKYSPLAVTFLQSLY